MITNTLFLTLLFVGSSLRTTASSNVSSNANSISLDTLLGSLENSGVSGTWDDESVQSEALEAATDSPKSPEQKYCPTKDGLNTMTKARARCYQKHYNLVSSPMRPGHENKSATRNRASEIKLAACLKRYTASAAELHLASNGQFEGLEVQDQGSNELTQSGNDFINELDVILDVEGSGTWATDKTQTKWKELLSNASEGLNILSDEAWREPRWWRNLSWCDKLDIVMEGLTTTGAECAVKEVGNYLGGQQFSEVYPYVRSAIDIIRSICKLDISACSNLRHTWEDTKSEIEDIWKRSDDCQCEEAGFCFSGVRKCKLVYSKKIGIFCNYSYKGELNLCEELILEVLDKKLREVNECLAAGFREFLDGISGLLRIAWKKTKYGQAITDFEKKNQLHKDMSMCVKEKIKNFFASISGRIFEELLNVCFETRTNTKNGMNEEQLWWWYPSITVVIQRLQANIDTWLYEYAMSLFKELLDCLSRIAVDILSITTGVHQLLCSKAAKVSAEACLLLKMGICALKQV